MKRILLWLLFAAAMLGLALPGCVKPSNAPPPPPRQIGDPVPGPTEYFLIDPATGKRIYFPTKEDLDFAQARGGVLRNADGEPDRHDYRAGAWRTALCRWPDRSLRDSQHPFPCRELIRCSHPYRAHTSEARARQPSVTLCRYCLRPQPPGHSGRYFP